MIATAAVLMWIALKPPPRAAKGLSLGKPKTYEVGTRFPALPNLSIASHPVALIVFVDKDCPPCLASMPFYRQLTQSARRATIIAMSFDEEATLRESLKENSFQPDEILSVPRGSVNVTATPTLLLLDNGLTVRAAWVGRLSRNAEEAILKLIN
jgi:thiol-disulfide isomerase/thioredoxin